MTNNPPPTIVPRCVTIQMTIDPDWADHWEWAFAVAPKAFLWVHDLDVAVCSRRRTIASVAVEAEYFARLVAECGSRRAAITELRTYIDNHAYDVTEEDDAKNPPKRKGDDEFGPDEIPF